MLLTHLKKVSEIDNKIIAIHNELSSLYKERLLLMNLNQGLSTTDSMQTKSLTTTTAKAAPLSQTEQWYRIIASAWEQYNVIVPAFTVFKTKLAKAEKVQKALEVTYPEIAACMEAVAVPPTKVMQAPASEALRNAQGLAELPDYADASVGSAPNSSKWRIVLIYGKDSSLYIGSTRKLLADKAYMFAGYDMRGLGLAEYTALTLQKNTLIDQNSWTVLLKGYKRGNNVPYAGYRHGRYRFELEDVDNVLDDDGFRPALEM